MALFPSLILLLSLLTASFKPSQASWINLLGTLGTTSTVSHYWNSICEGQDIFVRKQREICLKYPSAMAYIYSGARRSIQECRRRFFWERWNCTWIDQTVVPESRYPYGFTPPNVTEPTIPPADVMSQGTRESAYLHSITSAGVVHAITQACSAGNLTDCSCDTSLNIPASMGLDGQQSGRRSQARAQATRHGRQDEFVLHGCSDNIAHGLWFSQNFVDATEQESLLAARVPQRAARNDPDSLDRRLVARMNLHNNEAGRLAVKRSMKLQCRCHGVSGSCSTKTCFKALPTLAEIAHILKSKYDRAVEVARRVNQKQLRRKDKGSRHVSVSEDDMVFVQRSPSYCSRNVRKGIIGTRNRMCNKTIDGSGSCNDLCCDRGFNTYQETRIVKCNCKFIWCCDVQCKQCTETYERSVCK